MISPSVELNDTEFSRLSFDMTVSNKYPTAIVYNLSSVGAATVNPFIERDDNSVQMDTIYVINYQLRPEVLYSDASICPCW